LCLIAGWLHPTSSHQHVTWKESVRSALSRTIGGGYALRPSMLMTRGPHGSAVPTLWLWKRSADRKQDHLWFKLAATRNSPQTEEARRSIRSAYHGTTPELQLRQELQHLEPVPRVQCFAMQTWRTRFESFMAAARPGRVAWKTRRESGIRAKYFNRGSTPLASKYFKIKYLRGKSTKLITKVITDPAFSAIIP
jgi:hypothetical protein